MNKHQASKENNYYAHSKENYSKSDRTMLWTTLWQKSIFKRITRNAGPKCLRMY